MVKNKKSVGFRTKKTEEKEQHFEEWDIYPTHVIIEEDYWVCSHNIEYTSQENKNK